MSVSRKSPPKMVLARHASMILDTKRTKPLKSAIQSIVKEGDVVCDIGAGLGLLSFYALSAGAKHVYAIDCDTESLEAAIYYARNHEISNHISFIAGHSYNFDLDEKVDVLICETIGSAAFDENILATLRDAKRRLLKKGGKIIPVAISLWGAPAKFSTKKQNSKMITTAQVKPRDLLCKPACLASIKTEKTFKETIHIRHKFIARKNMTLHGLAVWPRIEWTKKHITDASPYKPITHWKQCLLPVPPKEVKIGESLNFELIIGPDPNNPFEQTEILWKMQSSK